MKVLHCCLASFYIDNYGYQENILPKMHKLQGHDVRIIASTETYIDNQKLGYIKAKTYINENDIIVSRIPYVKWVPKLLIKKLRIYSGLKKHLTSFTPDIIFLHDIQFLSIRIISNYAKKNPQVKIFVDGHTDFVNSAKGWVSKNILHKIIYRWCAREILPYSQKFYGTLPTRVDFFNKIYKIPQDKIELLEFGVDDSVFNISLKNEIRKSKRKELGLSADDFVIVSGGKIDYRKNIHLLIDAMSLISDQKIKLILFGTPDKGMEYILSRISIMKNISYLGWQKTDEILKLLLSSDLGFFPGTHSVIWEQACGVGLPCVFKNWDGIQHVDLGGNCIFLNDISKETISYVINELYNDKNKIINMSRVANEKCISHFSYYDIAQRAIK